jgi:hypothetical protein
MQASAPQPIERGSVNRQLRFTILVECQGSHKYKSGPTSRGGWETAAVVWRVRCAADYRWSDLNFTPIRSAPRHTTMQCRMALSKSSSNFGGSAAALGNQIAASVDEKFRTVQSITEAPLPIIIWPALRSPVPWRNSSLPTLPRKNNRQRPTREWRPPV